MGSPIKRWDTYFSRLLGLEYFDGPMAGVGLMPDGTAWYFKILGWDDEHHERVFAVAQIPAKIIDSLWAAFKAAEAPRMPAWYPQTTGGSERQAAIRQAISRMHLEIEHAKHWKVVESSDLVGSAFGVDLEDSEVSIIREMITKEQLTALRSSCILPEFLEKLRQA